MPNARDLPWKELDVDVVLECTGFYTSKAKSQAHIDAGAKRLLSQLLQEMIYQQLFIMLTTIF